MKASRKRQRFDEDNQLEKRQKKIIAVDSSTKKAKPVKALRLQETKTNSKVMESEKSSRIQLRPPRKTNPKVVTNPSEKIDEIQSGALKDLIAKARVKLDAKRQIDDEEIDIANNKRRIARLALNQVVPTVDFGDHLKYHRELEELGCAFIHDQVECLKKFMAKQQSKTF